MSSPTSSNANTNQDSRATAYPSNLASLNSPTNSATESSNDSTISASELSSSRSPSPYTIKGENAELIARNKALRAELYEIKEEMDELEETIDEQKAYNRKLRRMVDALMAEDDGAAFVALFRGLYDRIEALESAAEAHAESHDCKPKDG